MLSRPLIITNRSLIYIFKVIYAVAYLINIKEDTVLLTQ